MDWLGHFFTYLIPWQVWVVVGIAAAAAAWYFLGTKASLAVLGAAALAVIDRRARQIGRSKEVERQKAANEAARKKREKIDVEVEKLPDEEIRKELRKHERKPKK